MRNTVQLKGVIFKNSVLHLLWTKTSFCTKLQTCLFPRVSGDWLAFEATLKWVWFSALEVAVRLLLQQVNLPVVMKKKTQTKYNHNIATKYLETTVANLIMKLKSEFVKGLEFLGGERVTCTGTGKNIHHSWVNEVEAISCSGAFTSRKAIACLIVSQLHFDSSHSRLLPVNVLTVTGMLARWGGFSRWLTWGYDHLPKGGRRAETQEDKHADRRDDRKTAASADKWVHGGRYLTWQIELHRGRNEHNSLHIYVR